MKSLPEGGRQVFLSAVLFIILSLPSPLWGEKWAPAGLSVDLQTRGFAAPSFGEDQEALEAWGWSAGAGIEWSSPSLLAIRAETGFFSVGDSAWDASLFRYRAFYSWRTALLGGVRLPLGPMELGALAGFSLHLSRYSGLSAASAFPGLEASLGLSIPFSLGKAAWKANFGLPASLLFRGTARTWIVGVQASLSLVLESRNK